MDEKIVLKKAITGKLRGPQKQKAVMVVDSGIVSAIVCKYVTFKGESYFKLSNGNMIPKNVKIFMSG